MIDEFYDSKLNTSKEYSDRYKYCKVLTDRDTGDVLLETREIKDIPASPEDQYHRLESHEKNRLDILAQKYYQNPNMWWIIAQANGITDPFAEMEVGILLRIPSLSSLYGNNGFLLR